MPSSSSTPWNDLHTLAIVQHIVHTALATRPALYATPALSPVSNNGGDRINKKLQAVLETFVRHYPGAEGYVKAEVAHLSSHKKKGGGSGKTVNPKKAPKRKRPASQVEEDSDDVKPELGDID